MSADVVIAVGAFSSFAGETPGFMKTRNRNRNRRRAIIASGLSRDDFRPMKWESGRREGS
jgi:hypothetical protein